MAGSSNSNEQVNNSIKSIVELTTRIDERVQLMMKKQEFLESKIEQHISSLNELNTDFKLLDSKSGKILQEEVVKLADNVSDIETRLKALEKDSENSNDNWKEIAKTVFNFIVQIIWVIVASYILYKLNIQAPSLP